MHTFDLNIAISYHDKQHYKFKIDFNLSIKLQMNHLLKYEEFVRFGF